MKTRTRRLRESETLRSMVRETRVSKSALIYPLFVREGSGIEEALPSLPGQIRYSPDTLAKGIETALNAGVRSFLLFGIPKTKDENGLGAYNENGVIQQALKNVKKIFANSSFSRSLRQRYDSTLRNDGRQRCSHKKRP